MDDGTTVRDEFVTLNGLRFHYRDWGDPAAPPLLLLHALHSHARSWDTFARGMAAHFRVLALDQRGFGESAWADDYHEQRYLGDVAAFVEALGLATVALVGFSVGGAAACGYAAAYPQRVARMVLVECFTSGEETEDTPSLRIMRDHLATMRALPEAFDAPEEAATAYRPLAPYAPEEELRHWMRAGLARRPDGRWAWRYDPTFRVAGPPGRLTPSAEEFRARLARAACPTLLVVGAESWLADEAERMATVNPRARAVRLAGAGHWVPLDNPRGFLDVVGDFLNR